MFDCFHLWMYCTHELVLTRVICRAAEQDVASRHLSSRSSMYAMHDMIDSIRGEVIDPRFCFYIYIFIYMCAQSLYIFNH